METESNLKHRTAKSLKWNIIDKISSQLLYAVTGIILANILSQAEFGLVGVILVFQAFALMFVDSGFSSALIQKKLPCQKDYSTVFWFNLGISVFLYVILFLSAPLIAKCFQNDQRLIPLSRVMFISFILNALSIVQANRFMKKMDVRPIAASNAAGLASGAVTGIYLAISGYGAWAIVWQTIVTNGVKSFFLWWRSRWQPSLIFSISSLKSFFKVGSGVMMTSFLNTLFQQIYSFIIGYRDGLVSLGYYTQADKWSKMGITSVSQIFTSSFLPTLSSVQDDINRYKRAVIKINRLSGYILFPSLGFLIVIAPAIFHTLFGTKWDYSIILFQILLIRGIFTVLTGLYNNFLLSLGKAKLIVVTEIVRDVTALIAILLTLPYISLSTPEEPVAGLKILLYGQLFASVLTWGITLWIAAPLTGFKRVDYFLQPLPYLMQTILIGLSVSLMTNMDIKPLTLCIIQAAVSVAIYFLLNFILKSKIQKEAFAYIFREKRT